MGHPSTAQANHIAPAFAGSTNGCVRVEFQASTGCNPQATGYAGCLAPVVHPGKDRVNRVGNVGRHTRVRYEAHRLLTFHLGDSLESFRGRIPYGQDEKTPFISGIVRNLKVTT